MFAYCVGELGFSEDIACNRINVARAARRTPVILEALRSGKVHLAGLRLLAPHLTVENQETVLAESTGKSTRQIEALLARLAPQPPVPTLVRKLPGRASAPQPATLSFGIADPVPPPAAPPALALAPPTPVAPHRNERRSPTPLSEDTFKFQFTGNRACHDLLREAQGLLRHRIPDGDLASIFERALRVLVEQVKKERFATGRKARAAPAEEANDSPSRHIPDAIKREVFERDAGRCTFTGEEGRRCGETGALEFDHLDGFARTRLHRADRIRLLCRAHNQHAAEKMYGRAFMERARASGELFPGPSADSG
jgi:5-methylcytosine-specific restriction endonuclease McrA